jgi:hypothetical protein
VHALPSNPSIPHASLTWRVLETLITVPKERNMTKNNKVYETATTLAPSEASQSKTMTYYDLKKNWRRVKPHLTDKKLNDILVRDFNKFTFGRWGQTFAYGNLPCEFESCDWNIDHRGKHPAFWQYVKHAACHWLVNFNLRLAMLVEPEKPWRIITSEKHSTVWDGGDTLFEFNFQAFGIDPNKCFETSFEKELKPGKYLRVYLAESVRNRSHPETLTASGGSRLKHKLLTVIN